MKRAAWAIAMALWTPASTAVALEPDTLIWAEMRAPSTLHPLHANSGVDLRAQAPIHPPLARQHGSEWHHPLLREVQWQSGKAQLRLEAGTRFHDGTRVEATHICDTVDVLKRSHSVLAARVGPKIRGCSVDPKQPRTATLELSIVADEPQWDALGFPLLPTHLEGDLAAPGHAIAQLPVGTGSWSAALHPFGVHYSHVRGGTSLELRVIPEAQAIPELLRTGAIHGWPDVPGDRVAQLRSMPEVRLHAYPMRLLLGLAINADSIPTSIERAALQPSGLALCQLTSSPPPDAPPTCRPLSGPFHLEHPGRNQAVRPLPGQGAPDRIRLLISSDLDWPEPDLSAALKAMWSNSEVDVQSMPTSQWLGLSVEEVRSRWDVVVVQRFGDDVDLSPWLGPHGGLNPFRSCPPDVRSALRDGQPRELHAVHADAQTHLWWVQRDAVSAWSARLSSVWMTTPDGLGALEMWDLTEPPGPRVFEP